MRMGFSAEEVPIVVDKRHDSASDTQARFEFNYPLFTISISNDSESQVILTRAELTVHRVIPLLAAGESQPLESLVTYVLRIASRDGRYPLELVPPLKVAANDAATFSLRVLPLQLARGPTGKFLIASIAVRANDHEVATPKFMLYFVD